jgi:hypothetical protein
MNSRLIPALLFCMAFSAAARADAPAAGEGPGGDAFPFPLIPLMETVRRGAVFWCPDWPPELPPDAFSLPANARTADPAAANTRAGAGDPAAVPAGRRGIRSISLSPGPELRVVWDAEGRLREFPHFWKGTFYRTEVRYDAGGKLRGLSLAGTAPADGTADGPALEFELEPAGGIAAPLMVQSGDRVFWVIVAGGAGAVDGGLGSTGGAAEGMNGGGDTASETWYDGEGNFFGLVTYRFAGAGGAGGMDAGAGGRIVSLEIRDRWAESYRYYSSGAPTRVESSGGVYTAVYGEKGPLYRNYTPVPAPAAGPGADRSAAAGSGAVPENAPAVVPAPAPEIVPGAAPSSGTPVPAAASFPPETYFQWDERGFLVLLRNRDADGAFAGEFRYEYGTDDRGNWTVRREIEMVRRPGLLVPVFRGELRRRFVYAEAGE